MQIRLEFATCSGFMHAMKWQSLIATFLIWLALAVPASVTLALAAETDAPSLSLPKLDLHNYAPATQAENPLALAAGRLVLSASLTDDTPALADGIIWRVFKAEPGADGKLTMVAGASGGTSTIDLPAGTYLVHAAFGRAGATKKVIVGDSPVEEKLVLNAGGLMMNAEDGDGKALPPFKLKFSVYESTVDDQGERRLILSNIAPGAIVRLNAGTYHIVSNFGNVNAIVRTDIQVDPGVVTEATVEHRAAEVILKLVAEPGGEALADTAWSVFTESGEFLTEMVGAYAPMVLSEGVYSAVAKHRDKIFEKTFTVEPGKNSEVEVIAKF